MKTIPTVQVAEATDTGSLPELPEQAMLAMADIAGAAREGLLAKSVAAGLAVMRTMFEAEAAEVAGPKGKHDPDGSRSGTGSATGP